MRTLLRNKRTFYYCLYKGEEIVRDAEGYESGEKILTYDEAVEMKANISPATGNAQIEQFGSFVSYDKVIVTDDLSVLIDENSVLFVDKEPEYKEVVIGTDEDTGEDIIVNVPLYDYIVKRVAKSLNSVSIAISKVDIS